ncbi:glycerate kinase [Mycobacterium sp. SMC-8]|uniref:glycerate kinase n=1 Tax=Mycobacterium sp. SMC-8 TaxID=2857060 RepID=UPI0037CBA756
MRVLIALDSFKGSIDSVAAGVEIANGWSRRRPRDILEVLPTADGGEGSAAVIETANPGSQWFSTPVEGPDGTMVEGSWLLTPSGTAVVEVASACGLPQRGSASALTASTYGVGELLRHALDHPSVRRILVPLGGSAATDGGAGALEALGARLLNARGEAVPRGGAALTEVSQVAGGIVAPPPAGVTCLYDVASPLLGNNGAARQFGPQKGASPDEVVQLERGLSRWVQLLGGGADKPGTGAAGGTGYGLAQLWGAELRAGAPALGDIVGLPDAIDRADIIVCGEGRFDDQSFQGKAVGHILGLAAPTRRRVMLVAGSADQTALDRVQQHNRGGFSDAVCLADLAGGVQMAIADPVTWLNRAGEALAVAVEQGCGNGASR